MSSSLSRPLSTAAAIAMAAVSFSLPDRYFTVYPSRSTKAAVPSPESTFIPMGTLVPSVSSSYSSSWSSTTSVPAIHRIYHYAKIGKSPPPNYTPPIPSSSSLKEGDVIYKWHLPDPQTMDIISGKLASQTVVVILLGWLGSKQKHLRRYADWYTSRGFHVITFTYHMGDLLSYNINIGGDAEKSIELLSDHLAELVSDEDHAKNLIFHTFSNTGWLTYGAILDKFKKQDSCLIERIKGCVVDSAPVDSPDPQVWAMGFATAILKKQIDSNPTFAEVTFVGILEKLFKLVLNLPSVNTRLSGVLDLLSNHQPKCPQLYVYSSSDRVIPVNSVESFIDQQRKAGHVVRSCDFGSSPHVDHYRNHSNLYTSQLTTFLKDLGLTCPKD